MDVQANHEGKVHKPAANHPWRNTPTQQVVKWATETTVTRDVNNWKIGGGKDPWNK